jgi:hypothetical protein
MAFFRIIGKTMKRDMDLIRSVLLGIEDHPKLNGTEIMQYDENKDNLGISGYSENQVVYHIDMLIEAGLVKGEKVYGGPLIEKLTWSGHEFVDAVRDPDIWRQTKEGAKKASGFSLELLRDLAKGLIKKKIEEHTGIQL